jgi:hypothetical protein
MIPDVVALVASLPAARSQGCSRHPEEVMQGVKSKRHQRIDSSLAKASVSSLVNREPDAPHDFSDSSRDTGPTTLVEPVGNGFTRNTLIGASSSPFCGCAPCLDPRFPCSPANAALLALEWEHPSIRGSEP